MVWWINKHECSISNVFLCVIALPLSGTFKGHKIGMGFFGGQSLVQGVFGVLLEALGISLRLGFSLRSIIPVTWNREPPQLLDYMSIHLWVCEFDKQMLVITLKTVKYGWTRIIGLRHWRLQKLNAAPRYFPEKWQWPLTLSILPVESSSYNSFSQIWQNSAL